MAKTKVRKMLGTADAPYSLSLMRLIETQSKTTLVTWCLRYSQENILPIYAVLHPEDGRPRALLAAMQAWLDGKIKFPAVKEQILAIHAAARQADGDPAAQAALRALGQAASTIHMASHALGLLFYGAAARAYKELGIDASKEAYESYAAAEAARLEATLRELAVTDEKNPVKVKWYC
ncbi:MAG: hypothetical protein GX588_06410 [Clostridiaceae bacterium]|nr:hypothetical protein [Clostridiaceae bacterium]